MGHSGLSALLIFDRFGLVLALDPFARRTESIPNGGLGAPARSGRALCHTPEVPRLVAPGRFAFEREPPKTTGPKDATYNAPFLPVANENNSVAKLEIRLRFHRSSP
jgi:hypothetical protein